MTYFIEYVLLNIAIASFCQKKTSIFLVAISLQQNSYFCLSKYSGKFKDLNRGKVQKTYHIYNLSHESQDWLINYSNS